MDSEISAHCSGRGEDNCRISGGIRIRQSGWWKKNIAWNNISCCHRQHNAQERSKINNNKCIQCKRIACTLWKLREAREIGILLQHSSHPFECILFYRLTDTMRFYLAHYGYYNETIRIEDEKKYWKNKCERICGSSNSISTKGSRVREKKWCCPSGQADMLCKYLFSFETRCSRHWFTSPF